MGIQVKRHALKFTPDSKRVVTRFFNNGEVRTKRLILRILDFSDEMVEAKLLKIFNEFKVRRVLFCGLL